MKQVKGSMLKLVVKAARANKSGVYQKRLSKEALELVNETILDAVWYPFELHKEVHDAVALIDGNRNPRILFQWGQKYGEVMMTSIYRRAVDVDLAEAVRKYQLFHASVYNFGAVEAESLSDNELVASYVDFERNWELFYHIAFGWMQRFLELCLRREVSYQFLSRSWKGDKETSFRFRW